MIDIEDKVINDVSVATLNAFSTTYPSLVFYSEFVDLPAQFPCISMYEETNTVNKRMSTLNEIENFVDVSYMCNIYANGGDPKKTCKVLAGFVSDTMKSLGFVRTFCHTLPFVQAFNNQVTNINRDMVRMTIRFEAKVEKGIIRGSDTIYKIH